MAHDTHFLDRIERLNYRQADWVLALYRDAEAVRFLLSKLDLPDTTDRVALALAPTPRRAPHIGDRASPAHVVLARDGGFVTCLGAGMSTGPLPVIAADRVTRVLERFDALRDALDGEVTRGAAMARLKNLYHRAELVSREQFEGLRPLRVLLGDDLLVLSQDAQEACDLFQRNWRPGIVRDLVGRPGGRRSEDPEAREKHELSNYWRTLWAGNHLTLLLVDDVPDLERLIDALIKRRTQRQALSEGDADKLRTDFVMALTWSAARSRVMGLTLRGWYIAARMGRMTMASARKRIDRVSTVLTATHDTGGLAAVGLRHARFREEVGRLLARIERVTQTATAQAEHDPDPEDARRHCMRVEFVAQVLAETFRSADEREAARALVVQEQLMASYEALPHRDHPAAEYARAEDLPLDVGIGNLASADLDVGSCLGPYTELMAAALPFVARAEASDLFLPEAWLRPFLDRNRVDVEHVKEHLIRLKRGPKAPKPVVVQPKPGRNEPCTCGSGKKFKVCCGV